MARLIQHSLVLIVLLLHGRVCLGGNCSCLNADELPPNDDDESHKKCLRSCPTCSEDYAFIYKFNVIESCVGRCGQQYDISLPCQCNTGCTNPKYNNCCNDYNAFCLIESCAGRCKQPFDSNLECQCNTRCGVKKDCCADYEAFCPQAEYLHELVDPDDSGPIDTEMCMALHCDHHILNHQKCVFEFKVSCEHSEEGGIDYASEMCPLNGSFIQWDPSTPCINFDQIKQNWTGIMRSRQMLTSTNDDDYDEWTELNCKGGETSEELMLVKLSAYENCKDLMSFYCENGSSPQKSITTIMETEVTKPIESDKITVTSQNTSQNKSQNTNNVITGVIIGIVLSVIAIGVIICVVIVCRRRRRKTVLKQDALGTNDTENIESLENKNSYAYSEIEMEATNKNDHMDDGDEQYTTGPSDVYDHLNEHKNRKIKTENPHAIYDHSIGDNAESDYDSTKQVIPTNPDYQEVRIRSEDEIHREKL